jgi:hypothetical protein
MTESLLASEALLHRAVAEHPEVLPHRDFGLGPMITLANELSLAAGPPDLLLADPQGRLSMCEFKKARRTLTSARLSRSSSTTARACGASPTASSRPLAQRAKPGFETTLREYAEAAFADIRVSAFD